MSKRLFISHSTKDDAQVDRIANALEAAGFTVWVDHRNGIVPGTPNWDKAIRGAIVEADAGIFLMSERSLASDICSAECLLVRELDDPLYVMRLEACKPENIWLYIKLIQYADLASDFDHGVHSLIRVLNGEAGGALPQPVVEKFTGTTSISLHLPYFSNPLRGRDNDIEDIQAKLRKPPPAILQIVGTGGLGKSRLAAEVALSYPAGAVWHRCSPVSEPADLLALLREHLKLPADEGLPNVLAALAGKKPLIVIDNAEDMPDGSDRRRAYVEVLQQIAGRNVPVIMTTRTTWAELKPRREHAPAAVSIEAAAQIALDFANAEDVALSDTQAHELAQKARLHPRLIELAVGQLHERSVESVFRQLNELKHQDIQDALDEMIVKSVRQMAEQAKNGANAEALLRHLTILQGTFPLDAVKALAPDEMKTDDDRLEDALVTLQRWQFVRRDAASGRYSLGDLVREALGPPQNDAVFGEYATYYIAHAGEIFNQPLDQWKNHDHDLPNILALGDALITRLAAWNREEDPEKYTVYAAASFALQTNYFVAQRLEYQRQAWLDMGLSALRILGETRYEALLLHQLGFVWTKLGEPRKALPYYEAALPLRKAAGDQRGVAATLNNIGGAWNELGDVRKSLSYYEQALPILKKIGDQGSVRSTLNNVGFAHYLLGDPQKAKAYYEQALALPDSPGDFGSEAPVLNNLGLLWNRLGDPHKALAYYKKALAIMQAIGDRRGEAMVSFSIGNLYDSLEDVDQAIQNVERSIDLKRTIGHSKLEADIKYLEYLRRKRAGENVEEAFRQRMIAVYRESGESGLRRFLREAGVPENRIQEFVEAVKRMAR